MVDVYAQNPNVAFIAIEYGQSSRGTVESWISNYGWMFPVGINGDENEIYQDYGFPSGGYDTFFVIDADGVVSFIEAPTNTTQDFPRIRQAIDAAMATVPVAPTTWGRIKRLYQP